MSGSVPSDWGIGRGWEIAGTWHVNYPEVGDRHAPEECPGDGPWPCNRRGVDLEVER